MSDLLDAYKYAVASCNNVYTASTPITAGDIVAYDEELPAALKQWSVRYPITYRIEEATNGFILFVNKDQYVFNKSSDMYKFLETKLNPKKSKRAK